MIIILTIFQYLIQSTVDLMDKFLLSARKIEPINYTFYTVITGIILLVIWPWNFYNLPAVWVDWDMLSGALFVAAMYVFFLALTEGEASRVVPFVFGLVPVFDILLGLVFKRNELKISELAAVCLLVPGALLVSHQNRQGWGKHVALKVFSAFLFSGYYALWQFAAQNGPVLNNLMWNRIGAALLLVLFLPFAWFRKKVFNFKSVKQKASTSILFLLKQILGGANFIFLSFLFVLGKISVINSLQGFRYVFLLIFGLLLTSKKGHLMSENSDSKTLLQKIFGTALIFIGTILLFV